MTMKPLRPAALPLSMAALASLAILAFAPGRAHAAAKPDQIDGFHQMADEVTAKMLASPAYQSRAAAGRKSRIVLGNVDNNSDDENVRVEDIYNEIRDQMVATNTVRLFLPGELNADLIISPELTSMTNDGRGRRRHCFTLQLTLTTVSGEYVGAFGSERCTS